MKWVAIVKNEEGKKRVIKTEVNNGYTPNDFYSDLKQSYEVKELYKEEDYKKMLESKRNLKKLRNDLRKEDVKNELY